ncbi:hypothetical protein EI94DRAFT_1715193 [Lactarius quietus]|nr:hypothetical protein EI94DRAFT_1715193 [Lactarius quietus]
MVSMRRRSSLKSSHELTCQAQELPDSCIPFRGAICWLPPYHDAGTAVNYSLNKSAYGATCHTSSD